MSRKGPPWATEKTIALARELWEQGAKTTEIAARVGTTKNAIAGFAARNEWPPRPHTITGVIMPRKPRAYVRKADRPARPPPAPKPQPGLTERPPPEPAWRPPPPMPKDPRYDTCQMPLSDGRPWRYCGQPVVAGCWCRDCYHRCYSPPPRRGLRQQEAA